MFCLVLDQLPPEVPQILINRTPIMHTEFDVQLLGNCDTIVAELCRMAGWELKHEKLPGGTSNVSNMETNTNLDGSGEGGRAGWVLIEPNTYQFEGAILTEVDYEQSQSNRRKRAFTEDDDGVATANGSFGRRQSNHQEKFGRLRMDTESESDESQDDDQSKSSGHSGPSHPNSSFVFSPKPHFGFSHGTTEPHSGDIADLHKALSQGAGASLGILTQSRRGSDASELVQQGEEDEEQTEMREKFTEVMPKDLGESNDEAMDKDETSHSRRSSMADLEPISEEPAMDVIIEDQDEAPPSIPEEEPTPVCVSDLPSLPPVIQTSDGEPQAMTISEDQKPSSQEASDSFELPPFTAEEMAEVDKIELDL